MLGSISKFNLGIKINQPLALAKWHLLYALADLFRTLFCHRL